MVKKKMGKKVNVSELLKNIGQQYFSCITINLISQGFKFNSEEVHFAYNIREQKSHQPLTDLLEIHFLNLSAVTGTEIRQTMATKRQEKLINWLRFTRIHPFENRRCRC